MNGHLHLTAVHDPAGNRSFIGRQSFRAPMHVGKGDWRDGVLTVHAVNSTAGLFAGDRVEWRIDVEPGARLRLVSPSATRVHRAAREGVPPEMLAPAHGEQQFRVGGGGFLEVWPELFIPHAGCRYRQTTRIEIEPGGEGLFCESLAPGRVASGEAFAWESLQWATDIYHGGEHVARERWQMRPGAEPDPLAGWRGALGVPAPFYATVFFVSDRLGAKLPAGSKFTICKARMPGLRRDAAVDRGQPSARGGLDDQNPRPRRRGVASDAVAGAWVAARLGSDVRTVSRWLWWVVGCGLRYKTSHPERSELASAVEGPSGCRQTPTAAYRRSEGPSAPYPHSAQDDRAFVSTHNPLPTTHHDKPHHMLTPAWSESASPARSRPAIWSSSSWMAPRLARSIWR